MTAQWRLFSVFTSVVLASFFLTIPPRVFSFGTISTLRQKTEHERITRAALACRGKSSGDCFEPRSIDQLAGKGGSFGAVGAPDAMPFEEPPVAHCDNADFFDSATYTPSKPDPVPRDVATYRLQLCMEHLQDRFKQGTDEATLLLDSQDRIREREVNLEGADDMKADCTFAPSVRGRAKCNVFDGLGRMLHGIQDFYSHSNWVDTAKPPFTPENPPGLGRSAPAELILELRRTSWKSFAYQVPHDLSTGCYGGILSDKTPGVDECAGRVTHHTLNKDRGTIELDGKTSYPTTTRGSFGTNFDDAVQAAITETIHQWKNFRAELQTKYGARRSSLMICALTRDDPIHSCQGRKMAIVIDSSGSNADTDPLNLRIASAKAFNSMLITNANAGPNGLADRVTVIDFDSSARVIYPLGDPSAATFDGIDSSGGTYIAGGVAAAIKELTKDPKDPTADRSGIIVLTDGEDADTSALVAQINLAESLGIRVSVGKLSPSAPNVRPVTTRELHRREPSAELITAILKTGGLFSNIYSAETQKAFIDLVVTHGPTNLDNAKGSDDGVPLTPDLAVSGLVSTAAGPDIFTYHGLPGDNLNITIQSMKNQPLKAVLRDIRAAVLIKESTTDANGKAIIPFSVFNETDFELIISTTDANEVVYSVSLAKTPGSITEYSSGVSSSTFSTSSKSPAPLSLSTTTALSSSTSLSPSAPLLPSTPSSPSAPLSPSTPSSPSTPLSPPAPLSPPTSLSPSEELKPHTPSPPSLTSSTAPVLEPTTGPGQQVTVCTTYWTTFTANPPSSTKALHRRKLALSPHFDGILTTSLLSDSKETESSAGVFSALISIIGVQSALILGGLIWWSCVGQGQIGTTLQSDGSMRFIPEWMARWTSRHGYSKLGDGNVPLGESDRKNT